jgi:diguanylate cyclase (GGDEF)-like protein
MPITVTAPALLGTALLLALGFHRNRAVQLFAVLLAMSLALPTGDARLLEGALRFGPWLLAAAALLPEPGMLSRRNALFVLAFVSAVGLVTSAPAHVYSGLASVSAWLTFGLPAPRAAGLLAGIGSLLCLWRWAMTGRPMELGLVVVLALAALACVHAPSPRTSALLVACGGCAILAVLYASYRMAFIDGLTGLPNRRALDEALMRLSGGYALAMVDVDHFKQFNDTHGHDAGDIVLRTVGRTLRRNIGGHAYRYGGEEFCVVFEGARSQGAQEGCERARQAVAELKISIPAQTKRVRRDAKVKRDHRIDVGVTVSVGCAARGSDRRGASEVLRAADQALYKAKAKGRNRVVTA